ncbi:MAG: nicotinate-nucleotide--dimethylbenzimidazole phosphoribosyltransferase [Sinobacteraceae bacterium]|nr:nicotinate-nucleotide--dimethylbenzimidazole phosphoribosyltransferase [Nevskiaceae bacterium]
MEGSWRRAAYQRLDQLTKPQGSLGRLEDLAAEICEIQETLQPALDPACLLLFAADHGLANDGVSAYPRAVTAQMVLNFLRGGAAANVLSAQTGCSLRIIDVGVDADFDAHPQLMQAKVARGTASILRADAMSTEQLQRALTAGREASQQALDAGCRVVLFGEMGIGNTAISSLLMSEVTGLPLAACVGPGTGLDPAGVSRKLAMLERVRERHTDAMRHGDEPTHTLTLMQRYGGFEIAALASAISTVAASKAVALIDGFAVTVAALLAERLYPGTLDRCIVSHCSAEPAHRLLLDHLRIEPLLSLGLRLGEGSGALLALPLLRSSVALFQGMATFSNAGVSTASQSHSE